MDFGNLVMFAISVMASFGLAVILVEKSESWPISSFIGGIRYCLSLIHPKFGEMLDCTVCTSFWTALFMDCSFLLFIDNKYFLWPISGFATAGYTWIVFQLLNAIDPQEDVETSEIAEECSTESSSEEQTILH